MQQAAAPGQILITEATAGALRERYEVEEAGAVSIDGLPGGISVYRVLGPARHGGSQLPFVGRRAEMAMLRRRWRQVLEGSSATIAIEGVPGLGKTRLVEELRALSDWPSGAQVQGIEDRMVHPFAALQPALRSVFGHTPDLDLVTSLGLDETTASDALRAAGLVPMDDRRTAAVRAAVETFCAAAAVEPLLVVVEDAHWLDASTAEVIAALAKARCPGLMIVMTTRKAPTGPGWPQLDVISLGGLQADEARELLTKVRQNGSSTSDGENEPLDDIVGRAAGNPFFLIWLSRERADEQYEGVRSLLRPRSGVPPVVQQAVRSQIDGAHVEDDVTTMAAVIGMEFSSELLATALDRSVDDLQPALRKLQDHEIVRAPGGDSRRYRFGHSLVHDLAYDLLLAPARQACHRRVADVLAAEGSEDHATIGLHQDRAGRPVEAARSKLLAAQQCRRSNAYREGAALVDRVLELAGDSETELPQDIELEARELHANLAASVDPSSYLAGTSDRSGVLELLDSQEDTRRVVMAKTRDWAAAILSGDLRTSARLLYEVWRSGHDSFPEILVCNRNARGTHAAYRGHYAHAERLLCSSIEQMATDGLDPWLLDNWATPDDPIALAYSYAPPVLFQRVRAHTAKELLDDGWRRAESLSGGAHTMAHVGANAAVYWELLGDGHAALQAGEQIVAIGRELGLDFWELTGHMHERLGQSMIEPTRELIEQIEADGAMLTVFAPVVAGRMHLHAAESWLRLGETTRATQALAAVRSWSTSTGIPYLDAEELRLRAAVSTGEDRVGALTAAAVLAGRQGARRYRLPRPHRPGRARAAHPDRRGLGGRRAGRDTRRRPGVGR